MKRTRSGFEARPLQSPLVVQSSLSVTSVVTIDSFRQETFSAALTTPGETGPTAFGSHAGTEAVLAFASPFGCLISAFHKAEKFLRRELKAVILGWHEGLSMWSGVGSRSESRVASEFNFWNKQCKAP